VSDTVTTILLPLKNFHPLFLAKCLESVTSQNSPCWLLRIIVEPSELDRFSAELKKYSSDSRVRVIANEGCRLSGALNTGMRHATTPFVGILLSDDMWSPDAVRVLGEHQERFPNVDFFHSSRIIVDESGHPISGIYRSRPSFEWRDFLQGSPVKHLLCWRREKALSFGGMDESLNSVGPDDFDFPWLMLEHGATFMAIEDCLYVYRDHYKSYRLTTHLPLNVHTRELKRILRKHGVAESDIKAVVSQARRSYMRQCLYRSELERRILDWLGWTPRQKHHNYKC
jgi:glycosyltransferase involved in cell wall biosynthesis